MKQHKAIFMGSIVRKVYYAGGYYGDYEVWSTYKNVEDKVICKVDLDNPPLKEGDSIYVNELEKIVNIISVIRSTNNELIYSTDYYFEIIEDELTEKSKEQAEKDAVSKKKEYEERKRLERLKNKKWYQFWK